MTITLMIGIEGSGIDIVCKQMLASEPGLQIFSEDKFDNVKTGNIDCKSNNIVLACHSHSYDDIDKFITVKCEDEIRVVFFIDSLNIEYCKTNLEKAIDEKTLKTELFFFRQNWNKRGFIGLNKNVKAVSNWSAGLIM